MQYLKELTAEAARELLDYCPETGKVIWKERGLHWFKSKGTHKAWNSRFSGEEAGDTRHDGYVRVCLLYKRYLLHRVVWLWVYGSWPTKDLDHINHDPSDNRICNLRSVTRTENCRNSSLSKCNSSGTTGVGWKPRARMWEVRISADDGVRYIGAFHKKDDAIEARKRAEITYGYHENHGMKHESKCR